VEMSLNIRVRTITNLPWRSVVTATLLSACLIFGCVKAAFAHNEPCSHTRQQYLALHPLMFPTKQSYCIFEPDKTRGVTIKRSKREPDHRISLRRQRMSEGRLGNTNSVASRSSTALGCAPPILPRPNDWDLIDALHVEQIAIDADQERALASQGGAQDGYISRIPTHI
jgi:hypothetical protein